MANTSNTLEFSLPPTAYATFDAQSMKRLIIQRLNSGGVFTDQNYIGSNINAITEIVALTYSHLLFYLNQTSSESLFTEAALYENMNRIVKLIGYKPIGYQSAQVNFEATISNLPTGLYKLPRYAYLDANGVAYTLTTDASFSHIDDGSGEQIALTNLNQNYNLVQGKMVEYPLIDAKGDDFEVVTLVPAGTRNDVIVDHLSIDVYVYSDISGTWSKWTAVNSIFLENATSTSYEMRLNEKGVYEFTFGNGINGKKLLAGDKIAIYYLQSDGADGEIDVGGINNSVLVPYNTPQYLTIVGASTMDANDIFRIKWSNKTASTKFAQPEDVANIRKYAPSVIGGDNILITKNDYNTFIGRNFSGVLSTYSVLTNSEFIESYYAFLKNVTTSPVEDTKFANAIYKFGTNTAYNNIYIIPVPSIGARNGDGTMSYVTPALRNRIHNVVKKSCAVNINPVVIDPIYTAFSFAYPHSSDKLDVEGVASNTKLRVITNPSIERDKDAILEEVVSIINTTFSTQQQSLGNTVQISALATALLSVYGVSSIRTVRTDIGVSVPGVAVAYWSPVYKEEDAHYTTQDVQLEAFRYAFWQNQDVASSIEVV